MIKLFSGTRRTYLDWAAAAPVSNAAQEAFARAVKLCGNPSSPYHEGVQALQALEEARTTLARILEVKGDGVIFTSGATEANNIALRGLVMRLRERGIAASDIHILYLPSAHASVVETLSALAKYGIAVEALSLKGGALDINDLSQKLRPTTRLVALDGVCGETGIKHPTRNVRNALDTFAQKNNIGRILLHVDASQMPLAYPFDLTRLSADLVTLDASKVGGVRGVGVLAMRGQVELSGVMTGGGQEYGLRPGTEPVALASAFAAALTDVGDSRESFVARATRMREKLVAELTTRIPNLIMNEAQKGKEQAPHILNVSLLGRDTDYLVMLLDSAGFAVSTKSACESDSAAGSRAVLALTSDTARAESTLRISWGPSTLQADLSHFADALVIAVAFLDASNHSVPSR
jgi:cysteine desulfurase